MAIAGRFLPGTQALGFFRADRVRDLRDYLSPIAALILSIQAGRGIPGTCLGIEMPVPEGRVIRQHDQYRFAQGCCQMCGAITDGNDNVAGTD
jgi:hypothetical protein